MYTQKEKTKSIQNKTSHTKIYWKFQVFSSDRAHHEMLHTVLPQDIQLSDRETGSVLVLVHFV